MSLPRIAEVALLTIFDFIPIDRLLHLRIVCRRWALLISPSALLHRRTLAVVNHCQSVIASENDLDKKKTIVVRSGFKINLFDEPVKLVDIKDRLQLHQYKIPQNMNVLSLNFASLSNLYINFNDMADDCHLETVAALLQTDNLKRTLHRLHLTLAGSVDPAISPIAVSLIASIHHLFALRRLVLELDYFDGPAVELPLDFFNGYLKLDYYRITSNTLTPSFIDSQLEFICNAAVAGRQVPKTLSLNVKFRLSMLTVPELFPPAVARSFTSIRVSFCSKRDFLVHFPPFCEAFSRLRVLQLHRFFSKDEYRHILLSSIARHLPHLTDLSLGICPAEMPAAALGGSGWFWLPSSSTTETKDPLPILPSVIRLTLQLSPLFQSPQHCDALRLAWVFPHLTILRINKNLFNIENDCEICASPHYSFMELRKQSILVMFSVYCGPELQTISFMRREDFSQNYHRPFTAFI